MNEDKVLELIGVLLTGVVCVYLIVMVMVEAAHFIFQCVISSPRRGKRLEKKGGADERD